MLLIVGFAASTTVSFLCHRFLQGLLFGISCLFVYVLAASLRSAGWKLEGLLFSLGWSIAVLLVLAAPVAVISAIAAIIGAELAKRLKSREVSLDSRETVLMPSNHKKILVVVTALTFSLMFIGGVAIE